MATQTQRGRPRKDNKRAPLSLRIAPSLRERLESAVAENGRSITHEAELRLEQTFLKQGLLPQVLDLAFGHVNADFLHVVGVITKQANLVARRFGDDEHWRDDASVFKAVKDLIDELFAKLCPLNAANEIRTRNAKHIIRGAVMRDLVDHNWVSRRYSDARATLFENWLKMQQVRFDDEVEPSDVASLVSQIIVLDDSDQPEGEQK